MKTQVELKITGNSTRSVSLSKGLHFQHKIGSILSAALEKNIIGMGFQLVNFACNWRYLPIESTFLTKGTKTQMDIWCQDFVRSRWLSAVPYIPRKGIKGPYKRSSGATKTASTSLCWKGAPCMHWHSIHYCICHSRPWKMSSFKREIVGITPALYDF